MELRSKTHGTERVVFLDNLRYLMVLLVVVLHASISYGNFVPWWAVRDTPSAAMDMVLVGLDIFLMPVLFFIAGYFGVSSLNNHGPKIFIRKKLRRLGTPLLISAPIAGCLFAYVHHYTRGSLGVNPDLWNHWLDYMATALNFHIGQILAVNHFSHSHLWFMSVLLFFFLVMVPIRSFSSRMVTAGQRSSSTRSLNRNILFTLAIAGLGSTLSLIAGTIAFTSPGNPEPWYLIANLIHVQPHKLMLYGIYLGMGGYAFHKQWFSRGRFPGGTVTWTVVSIVLFIVMLATLKEMMTNFTPGLLWGWLLLRSFICLTILAAFLSFAIRRWNRRSKMNSLLAANSYHIYILHFIVVILLQLLMLQWPEGPALLKFCIVSAVSILASLGLSHYVFRPYPVWSVVAVVIAFGMALAVVRPTIV